MPDSPIARKLTVGWGKARGGLSMRRGKMNCGGGECRVTRGSTVESVNAANALQCRAPNFNVFIKLYAYPFNERYNIGHFR